MHRKLVRWSLGALALVFFAGAAQAAEPGVGDPAPPFEMIGSDGKAHKLAAEFGRRGVVLAWFPAAFTPG